jgi:hypothetical protein
MKTNTKPKISNNSFLTRSNPPPSHLNSIRGIHKTTEPVYLKIITITVITLILLMIIAKKNMIII